MDKPTTKASPERKKGALPDPRETRDVVELSGLVTHLGLLMAASVGIGLAMGLMLDRWTGHGLWTLVFILLGVASGFWASYKAIRGALDRSEDRWNSDPK